jgi:Flp pilus assembly protein TadD
MPLYFQDNRGQTCPTMYPGTEIAAAVRHHNAGRLAEAEHGYRAILRHQPRHAEAPHLLGLVAHQSGDDLGAADLIRQAIAVGPRNAIYHANLGVVLLRLRHVTEAAAALRNAVRLGPSDFAGQSNLDALSALGEHAGAVKAAGAALRLRPGDAATPASTASCAALSRTRSRSVCAKTG